jgi:hypothetical protein
MMELDAWQAHHTKPRPADVAELARLVAKELRRRGIWAESDESVVVVPRRVRPQFPRACTVVWHIMNATHFDNLTPRECADVIQAEEAHRAQEWAGDSNG